MKTRCVSVFVMCAAMFALQSFADDFTYYYWKGGNGDWNLGDNWLDAAGNPLGACPNGDYAVAVVKEDYTASITVGPGVTNVVGMLLVRSGATLTIGGGGTIQIGHLEGADWCSSSIDGAMIVNDLTIYQPNASRVKIKGSLTLEEGSCYNKKGGDLFVNEPGATFTINGGSHYFRSIFIRASEPGAMMIVNGGRISMDPEAGFTGASDIYLGNAQKSENFHGNRFIQNGGEVFIWPVADPGTEFILNDGVLSYRYVWAYGGTFTQNGGSIRFAKQKDADSIPPYPDLFKYNGGAQEYANTGLVSLFTNANQTVEMVSSLIATNGPNAGFTFAAKDSCNLVGGKSIIASQFVISGGVYAYLDIDSLVIGKQFSNQTACDTHFHGDIVFGAFGDWSVPRDGTQFLRFHGDVTIDTLDWFDRTTAHTISMHGCWPDDGTRFEVKGGGKYVYGIVHRRYNGIDYAVMKVLRELEVKENTTFELSTNGLNIVATDRLILGPGAKLRVPAGCGHVQAGQVTVDPTARIEVFFADGEPIGDNCPLLEGDFGDLPDGVLQIPAEAATRGYETRTIGGTVFFDNGVQHTPESVPDEAWVWTGASSASWANAANWTSVSSSGYPQNKEYKDEDGKRKYAIFTGTHQMQVTFSSHGYTWTDIFFAKEAGPFVIEGENTVKSFCGWGAMKLDGYQQVEGRGAVASLSSYPALLKKPVCCYYDPCGLYVDSPSYLEYAAGVDTTKTGGGKCTLVRILGDNRFGGTSVCDTLSIYDALQQYPTNHVHRKTSRLTVLTNATFTVTKPTGNLGRGSVVVQKGATMTFQSGANMAYYDIGDEQDNLVEGTLDINCPLWVKKHIRFFGDGQLYIASMMEPDTAWNASLVLGKGINLTCGSWVPASSTKNYSVPIVATNGLASLTAPTAAWRYGVADDYAGPVAAEKRAMQIGRTGHLVIASTNGYPIVFSEQILGKGRLEFAEGAKISFAGDLMKDVEAGEWMEFARVGSVVGEPALVGCRCEVMKVSNPDGTVSLLFKQEDKGTIIRLR